MAALKLNLDTLDGIDEAIKSLYVADGDKYKLAVDGIEDTSGLKSALQKERRDRAELEKKVKKWESLGKSDDEIAELVAKQEEVARTEAERRGEWDKLRAQMNEKHQTELRNKDETIGQMRKRLEAELIDSKALSAIAAADGNPKLLLKVVKDLLKVDDTFSPIVVDAKGDPRVNAKGEPLTISELIAEIKTDPDYGQAFKGSGQSGGGMQPSNGSGGPGGRVTKADLEGTSAAQRQKRAAYIKLYGHAAYFALPEK